MNITSSIPKVAYNDIVNLTAQKKPQVAVQPKQPESGSSARKGIIPGISGEFMPKAYPTVVEFTLGGKIDVRG